MNSETIALQHRQEIEELANDMGFYFDNIEEIQNTEFKETEFKETGKRKIENKARGKNFLIF